jgi:uncharacterized protein YfiM (DUF2279 family)
MGLLFRALLLLLLLLVAGTGVALVLMVENEPSLPVSALRTADLRQARVFLESSDPRRLEPGEMAAFTMTERELELLLNYLLENLYGGRSRVAFAQDSAELELSVGLPDNLLGSFLNIRIALTQWTGVLALDEISIGSLELPGWLADPVMQRTHEELKRRIPEYAAAVSAINAFSIGAERINIVYQWQPELLEQISSRGSELLVSAEDRERLLAHTRNLAALLRNPELAARVPLTDLLGPMFGFAQARAGDAVEENRAALLALSMYATGISAARLLGEPAEALPELPRHQLLLSGRRDFAQHFLISAGLAISAGTGAAQSIGLLKEMDDSQDGGSGFSFTDIAADRTGIRFGELAVADPLTARSVQQRLAGQPAESLFMADFRDLPEFLSGEAFTQGYGGVGAPAYDAVVRDIEERIGRMPLFSELE